LGEIAFAREWWTVVEGEGREAIRDHTWGTDFVDRRCDLALEAEDATEVGSSNLVRSDASECNAPTCSLRASAAGEEGVRFGAQRIETGPSRFRTRRAFEERASLVKQVAIYARVSSDQQAQQATVDSQVTVLKEKAEAEGHIVLPQDVYVDDGFSGATLVRPALERLRDRVSEGGLQVVYVHNPDRLARKYAYQVLLLDEFRNAGVAVHFVHGPAGQSAEDELLVQVQGMIAEYERAKILERCRRGKLHRARQGSVNPLSGAPYGYLYVKKSDEAPATYRILLHEAKVVRSIFDRLVRQQQSIGQIVRELNAQGIPTRRGAPRWDRATVWGILGNPAYKGKAAFGKTEAVEARNLLRPIRGKGTGRRAKSAHRDKPKEDWIYIDVPAIVSTEVFDAAEAQLERNRRLSHRNGRGQRYLLQGLTVCAQCGYAFYGKTVSKSATQGGRRYAYYRCVGTDGYRFGGDRICHNLQVRVDQLDGYVWDSVCQLLRDPERVMQEWSQRGCGDGVNAELREQRDHAARFLAVQERTLKRLLDAYEAGVLELAELTARSKHVRARIEEARSELQKLEQQLDKSVQLQEVIAQLEDFSSCVEQGLEQLTWQQRKHLIRTLVAKVEIDPNGATVVYRIRPTTSPSSPAAGPTSESGSSSQAPPDPSVAGPSLESCLLRKRGDHPALRRARFREGQAPLVEHAGVQPLTDQA
jgi:site-specific DNA recombinase